MVLVLDVRANSRAHLTKFLPAQAHVRWLGYTGKVRASVSTGAPEGARARHRDGSAVLALSGGACMEQRASNHLLSHTAIPSCACPPGLALVTAIGHSGRHTRATGDVSGNGQECSSYRGPGQAYCHGRDRSTAWSVRMHGLAMVISPHPSLAVATKPSPLSFLAPSFALVPRL